MGDSRGITLPTLNVEPGIRRGRSVYEAYQRGWGLQFGKLGEQVTAHPLYKEALAAIQGRSIVEETRLQNMFLIVTMFFGSLRSQNIIEFGAFRGGTSLFLAMLLKRLYPQARLFSLDTFAGMPPTDKTVDAHNSGDFREPDLPGFQRVAKEHGLTNIEFVMGLFEDTFPTISNSVEFGLAHIDSDIYSSVHYSYEAVWPRMAPGGYIVFDDATVSSCIGATQAVEELIMNRRIHSEQIWPHFVFRAGLH